MNNFKGYGFRPSEEELISYLKNRTFLGRDYVVQDITDLELDICNWEPWDLPGQSTIRSNDPAWYFTYPITYKHPNSHRKMMNMPTGKRKPINRATKDGKWKVSGDRIKVKASNSMEEIGIKTRLYFYTDDVNEKQDSHKNKATKQQKFYQNKTPWVLYEYELINVDPSQNKYFLGKLMKQSEATKMSSNKGETSQQLPSNHILALEVQQDFYEEPLVEMEVSNDYDWIQNQTSISEPASDQFVNQFPVFNCANYPEESFANAENEVISNPQPPNVENYVADDATAQNLQVDVMREPEEPNICFGAETLVPIDNDETERSNQHNSVAESERLDLPYNFNNYPIMDISQMDMIQNQKWFEFDDLCWDDGLYLDELFKIPEPVAFDNNCNGVQNQSSINQQVADGQFKPPEDKNDGVQNQSSIEQQVADGNDGVQNRSSINQQDADDQLMNSKFTNNEVLDERSKAASADMEGSSWSSLGMSKSFHPMELVRKRSGMELEGSSIDIETELAQAQAKKSRF